MSEYDDSHMLSKTLERIAAQAKHLKEKIDLGLEIPSWAEYKVYSAYDGIGKALGTAYPGSYGESKAEVSLLKKQASATATKVDPQKNEQSERDAAERRRRNILLGSAGALGALGLGALGLRTLKRGLPNQMPNQMPNLNPSTIQSASAIPQEVKAQFVQQRLQKHMDDYTRYEMGLKAIEHDLSPEEVQQAIREATGGRESEIRHAAPTLFLFDDRWMWRKGELEPLVNDSLKKMGHPPLAPGSSMVDGRVCDFTRDCARDIANKRFPSPIDSPFTGKTASATATKTDPQKWEQAKAEARAKMGGKHSARAMQLATKIYKDKGGGYSGAKPSASNNSLKKWTKQDWNWTGGDKPGEGGRGVYLPKQKADRLRQTEEGKDRLAKAARQKREATRQGEQYSSHGLAANTSLSKGK
jgi:hypothetical protein